MSTVKEFWNKFKSNHPLFYIALTLFVIGISFFLLSLAFLMFDFKFINLINLSGVSFTGLGAILIWAVFNEQQKLISKQQFETTFFNMINIYHSIKNSSKGMVLDKTGIYTEKQGQLFFAGVLNMFKNSFSSSDVINFLKNSKNIYEINEFNNGRESRDSINEPLIHKINLVTYLKGVEPSQELLLALYEYHFQKFQPQLSHYFRFLYNVIKLTISERSKYKDEDNYISLIQAQMSNDELGLFFYNSLSKYALSSKSKPKLFDWLNEYDFFQNIDQNALFNRRDHMFFKTKFKFLSEREWESKSKYHDIGYNHSL